MATWAVGNQSPASHTTLSRRAPDGRRKDRRGRSVPLELRAGPAGGTAAGGRSQLGNTLGGTNTHSTACCPREDELLCLLTLGTRGRVRGMTEPWAPRRVAGGVLQSSWFGFTRWPVFSLLREHIFVTFSSSELYPDFRETVTRKSEEQTFRCASTLHAQTAESPGSDGWARPGAVTQTEDRRAEPSTFPDALLPAV